MNPLDLLSNLINRWKNFVFVQFNNKPSKRSHELWVSNVESFLEKGKLSQPDLQQL